MVARLTTAALAALVALAVVSAPASAGTAEYAEFVDYDYKADIVYFVTWIPTAPKWFIGPCIAHEANPAHPVRLLETEHKFKADIEVRLVDDKFFADRVFCLR